MFATLGNLFAPEGSEPHGPLFFRQRPLLWLYVALDALIALSYYMIAMALIVFVRGRRDLALYRMFLTFSDVFTCGATQTMGIWQLREPVLVVRWKYQGDNRRFQWLLP
jgi:hypothetical protein